MVDGADRRIFERIPVDFPVKFKNATQDKEGAGFCVDISAGGAGVFCKDKCELNDKLDLWVDLPNRYDPLHLSGEIVWLKETQPQVWRLGIEFSEVHFMDLATVVRMAQ